MKKLNKKLNRTRNLSIFAIAFSGVMFIMWCCNAGGFKAVELDAFVGVIVALLAIIVTIAIGWQIWAAMDLKSNIAKLDSRIQEIENLKKQFGQQQEDIKQLTLKNHHAMNLTWGDYELSNRNYWLATYYYLLSLYNAIAIGFAENIPKIRIVLEQCKPHITTDHKLSQSNFLKIEEADKAIRKSSIYFCISDYYDKVYKNFIEHTTVDYSQR